MWALTRHPFLSSATCDSLYSNCLRLAAKHGYCAWTAAERRRLLLHTLRTHARLCVHCFGQYVRLMMVLTFTMLGSQVMLPVKRGREESSVWGSESLSSGVESRLLLAYVATGMAAVVGNVVGIVAAFSQLPPSRAARSYKGARIKTR